MSLVRATGRYCSSNPPIPYKKTTGKWPHVQCICELWTCSQLMISGVTERDYVATIFSLHAGKQLKSFKRCISMVEAVMWVDWNPAYCEPWWKTLKIIDMLPCSTTSRWKQKHFHEEKYISHNAHLIIDYNEVSHFNTESVQNKFNITSNKHFAVTLKEINTMCTVGKAVNL